MTTNVNTEATKADLPDLSDVCCIVPEFNEGEVIGPVIAELCRVFQNVVCVDDGSSDGSGLIALNNGAYLIRHCVNIGQGGALSTGFKYALSIPEIKYVVCFDADGQHQVRDAIALIRRIKQEKLDVVLGSRFAGVSSPTLPHLKRAVLRLIVFIRRVFTNSEFTDVHNGLRAFTSEALNKIEITQFGMAHASEITQQIQSNNLRVAEEPVTVIYSSYSMRKGQSLLNGINILSEMVWR
jgi:glycosyltransferase involved in cell wall biosynthesis